MTLEEIKKLAELARIEMTEEKMLSMAGDFDPILAYVGQIQEANISIDSSSSPRSDLGGMENVVREDLVTNEPGSYSKDILDEIPETEKGYLKVKQIL